MTQVRIMLGGSDVTVYAEATENELQEWLRSETSPDDLVSLLLPRNGSVFYRDWQDAATIMYQPESGQVSLRYWHAGQEFAEAQEFGYNGK